MDRLFLPNGPFPSSQPPQTNAFSPPDKQPSHKEKVKLPDLGEAYVVFWRNETPILHSSNSPPGIPPVPPSPVGLSSRTRGIFRELTLAVKGPERIVVGRSIASDLADLRRQTWLIMLAGSAIAAFGLLGGWWLATHAIKPIDQISATAEKIASGNLAKRISIFDTQTELGRLAATLNATFDRLQSAYEQVQAALQRQTEFTADASHELRTPLSVILAEANSALARERTPQEYQESMQSVQRSARQMRQLTDSMLTLARLDVLENAEDRTELDLSAIVDETIQALRPLAEQFGVTLTCQLNPVTIKANDNQIRRLTSNLVSNAIYYNRLGGSVSVTVVPGEGEVKLIVTDDGQGISPIDLPHIFERFYRADKSRTGTDGHVGLGLAISKAIVDAHAGAIDVTSTLGKGTSFTVRLTQ